MLNCPKCSVPLTIAQRQRVEIDFCPDCRGVWLDRGELDKILDRANSTEARQDGRGYDARNPRKKRESWLGELFDF